MNPIDADADALTMAAASLYQRGEWQAAESCSREALKVDPEHLGAFNMLAVSLNAQGRHSRAAELFAELTRREPAIVEHWINLGTALMAQHRYDDALVAYAHAASRGAASADFFYNVGLVHIATGSYEAARTVLRDAVRLAPDDAEICYQYAVCCNETVDLDEAARVLGGWQLFRGLTTELVAKIGSLLLSLGEPRLAQRAVERALQDPRPTPGALLAIAQAFERTNRLAEARTAIARLESAPQAADLRSDLLLMKARIAERDGHHEEAIAGYLNLLAGTAEEHRRHHQLFPLAKALDAAGRYEEAYETLEAAHHSQVEYLRLTSPNAAGRTGPPLRITQFGCEPADVAAWNAVDAPAAADSPIFIVGFPRSGTTLLEQTLDAHPSLKSMDETRCLHQVIDHLVDSDVGYPERLSTLGPNRLREAREMYWALARRRVDLTPGQRLVDKNPMNLLGLPAIRLLFPNARILLAIRHPCDVILSCYMQHFRAPEFAMLCSDLPRLGSAYTRAFDFWYRQAEILGPKVLEIRYETFVADFEPQVRAVAAFLELPWMDAMLQPGEHARRKGFISTPSYTQVIQPVNQKSIGRWQHYARHFEGVIGQVRPYLDRWNYVA